MSKEEAFKNFVSKHPQLVIPVKEKEKSWQELFEIYDMYGEDKNAWGKYLEEESASRALPIGELTALIKGINIGNVQKYITNCQKAINVIQELTSKAPEKIKEIPKTARPITKFFGD